MTRWTSLPRLLALGPFGLMWVLLACELDEVALAESQDVPVVEAYILLGDGQDQTSVFLHWTVGTRPALDLLGREVVLEREDGQRILLVPEATRECLRPGLEDDVVGVCYVPDFDIEGFFQPGTRVTLTVGMDEGQVLEAETRIPQDIQFASPAVGDRCALPPGTQLNLVWNRSPGVWAYSAETEIGGLKLALAMEGIEVETDSVALLGLAVSDADTTIVFPGEFGIFDRFDLEQEVALALQRGLPLGSSAVVTVGALDRNYGNWVRGGNFNPSGPVRVSSVRGPGVGVLGSAVRRTVQILGSRPDFTPGSPLPPCIPDS